MPRCRQASYDASEKRPWGGLKKRGRPPVAASKAPRARARSSRAACGRSVSCRTCSKPWSASSWPRAAASRATAWLRINCSPTTKKVARTPADSSASSTARVPSGSGPSSNVNTAPDGTRSSPGMRSQSSASSSGRTSALGALLARLQQPLAQLLLLLGRGIELRQVRQLVERAEAEQLLEQRGCAVEDGPELRAAGFLDQAALEQRRDRRLRRDTPDPRDLGP